MEFPHPDVYDDFRPWGRQLISKLVQIPTEHKIDERVRWVFDEGLYVNGWADHHFYYAAHFWMDSHGYVHLGGMTKKLGQVFPQTMFTLPAEYVHDGVTIQYYTSPLTIIQVLFDGSVQFLGGNPVGVSLAPVQYRSISWGKHAYILDAKGPRP